MQFFAYVRKKIDKRKLLVYYTVVAQMRHNIVCEVSNVGEHISTKKKYTKSRQLLLEWPLKWGIDKATLYRRIADGQSFTIGEIGKIADVLQLSHAE